MTYAMDMLIVVLLHAPGEGGASSDPDVLK